MAGDDNYLLQNMLAATARCKQRKRLSRQPEQGRTDQGV